MTATPRQLPSGKFQGAYKGPDGRWRTKTFPTKTMARNWAQDGEAALRARRWADPSLERRQLRAWWEQWWAGRVVEANTEAQNRALWDLHVEPRWGSWEVGLIERPDVQVWVRDLTVRDQLAPSTVGKIVGLLSAVLNEAVEARAIIANPAQRLRMPSRTKQIPRWLTHDEHDRLVAAFDERLRDLVFVGPYTGMRIGELLGLHVGRVNLRLRQIHVVETIVEPRGHLAVKDSPKNTNSIRVIPLYAPVVERLRPLVEGRDPDELVWRTSRRPFSPYRPSNFRAHYWHPAAARAGIVGRLPTHVMRHTAASWLVQAGVPLYDVQEFLGHGSVQMTQHYAHLAPTYGLQIRDAFARSSHPEDHWERELLSPSTSPVP